MDRRMMYVTLSPKCGKLMDEISPPHADQMENHLRVHSQREETADSLLKKTVKNVKCGGMRGRGQ